MSRLTFRAMGTEVLALVPKSHAGKASLVQGLFDRWERTLSRFQAQSELSYVNGNAGSWVEVSPLFWEVASAALQAARATGGLFDPTLQKHLCAMGYDRSFERITGTLPEGGHEPLSLGLWRRVSMDPAGRRIRLPRQAGFDFGGIAKGMAVDAALSTLEQAGAVPALVDAGGDLAVRGRPVEGAWPIGIPGTGAPAVWLSEGALATSGTERRRWRQGGVWRHHLVDPRTGLPAGEGLSSVTVAAQDCMRAEVAAKVAFLLGPEKGPGWIEARGLGASFVFEDGSRRVAGTWPQKEGSS